MKLCSLHFRDRRQSAGEEDRCGSVVLDTACLFSVIVLVLVGHAAWWPVEDRGTERFESSSNHCATRRLRRQGSWSNRGGLLFDLRVALRRVVANRWVSSVAVVAFALGIGVTTAVFSIFNGVLLAPLPYPHPDQLVMVYDTQPACATCPASFPKYHDWRTRNQVFSAIGGSTRARLRADRPAAIRSQVRGALTTASLVRCVRRPAAARPLVLRRGRPAGRPEGRRARARRSGRGSFGSRSVDPRPHADLRRRALRSDRRHAAGLRAPARRRLRAAAAQARSGDARQPFPASPTRA